MHVRITVNGDAPVTTDTTPSGRVITTTAVAIQLKTDTCGSWHDLTEVLNFFDAQHDEVPGLHVELAREDGGRGSWLLRIPELGIATTRDSEKPIGEEHAQRWTEIVAARVEIEISEFSERVAEIFVDATTMDVD